MKMMKNPMKNVMLVEKWNGKWKDSLNYLMEVILLYLEAFHSLGKSMFINSWSLHPFGRILHLIVADIDF
jgi:hypothetical protein